MRWVAIFHDAPGMVKVRTEKGIAEHYAYLKSHATEILIAGPLREAAEGQIVGGLWIMEVGTREQAVYLVEHDPYFGSGYRTYRLLTWAKALEEMRPTL